MKKLLVLSLSVALLGAGCSTSPSRPSAEGPGPSIAVGEPNPSAPSSAACANVYFPSKQDQSITYQSNTPDSGAFTQRITKVDDETIHMEITFSEHPDITLQASYRCSGESIVAEGYLDLSAALSGTDASFETLSQEGVFLPKDLRVGSEWDTTYAVEGKFTTPAMGNQPVNMKQSIAMQQKALAEESVTVPAGTFTAIKIEQKTTVTIDFGANAIMQQFASQMPPITTTNYL